MEKIKMWIVSILLRKYAMGYLIDIFKAVRGKKTQICAGLAAVVYAAKIFGYLPEELSEQLLAVLGGAGSVSFLAKLKGYEDKIKEVATEIKNTSE